jgi:hypothetical protein
VEPQRRRSCRAARRHDLTISGVDLVASVPRGCLGLARGADRPRLRPVAVRRLAGGGGGEEGRAPSSSVSERPTRSISLRTLADGFASVRRALWRRALAAASTSTCKPQGSMNDTSWRSQITSGAVACAREITSRASAAAATSSSPTITMPTAPAWTAWRRQKNHGLVSGSGLWANGGGTSTPQARLARCATMSAACAVAWPFAPASPCPRPAATCAPSCGSTLVQ